MEGKNKNCTKYFAVIGAFATIFVVFGSKNVQAISLAVIEENVSATANSGGNVTEGSGEIKTGNASASSSSSTTVKGSGETKVDVKTEAEANGKKVEAQFHEQNSNEDINIQKKVEEDGSEAQTTIDISTQGSDPAGSLGSELENESSTNAPQPTDEKKNILVRAAESLSSAAKNMFERIISIFG